MKSIKITKKQFVELLSNNKSIFLGSYHNLTSEPIELIKKGLSEFIPESTDERRTVKAIKSNGLLFSNGSFLDLNQYGEKSYHRIGESFVCQVTKIDYDKDSTSSYEGIVYSIIVYFLEF